MEQLNLPTTNIRFAMNSNGLETVYDSLRKKFVVLTPEEWVRQNFTRFLINHLGYPESLMANEIGIKLNNTARRCDTVVFDHTAKPLMIVEYKAPTVAITQKVFDQIVRYNMVLRARYLVVSNGMNHFCCLINYENHSYEFLRDIPRYEDIK